MVADLWMGWRKVWKFFARLSSIRHAEMMEHVVANTNATVLCTAGKFCDTECGFCNAVVLSRGMPKSCFKGLTKIANRAMRKSRCEV